MLKEELAATEKRMKDFEKNSNIKEFAHS
jgi:hypothetical protein